MADLLTDLTARCKTYPGLEVELMGLTLTLNYIPGRYQYWIEDGLDISRKYEYQYKFCLRTVALATSFVSDGKEKQYVASSWANANPGASKDVDEDLDEPSVFSELPPDTRFAIADWVVSKLESLPAEEVRAAFNEYSVKLNAELDLIKSLKAFRKTLGEEVGDTTKPTPRKEVTKTTGTQVKSQPQEVGLSEDLAPVHPDEDSSPLNIKTRSRKDLLNGL